MTDEISSAFPGVRVGERIEGQVALSPEEIATFARLCGDQNPLHHDETYARQTRFGGLIACGPHMTSLMMGLIATYFSRETAMLGLEFTFHFRKAVLANELIAMRWEVTEVVPKASLGGEIVMLEGQASNQQGQVVLAGVGKVLVTTKL
ncbi:MAG TPA: MaoC family dehydratase [Ktedonosporobacter sp.]|nr:MaoC family dehydratase [Ktedonosporobacter sp.]